MVDEVYRQASDFDVIHFHIDGVHFPAASRHRVPNVTTLHGRLDLPYIRSYFDDVLALPFVSISADQRKPMPWLNWSGTVYHGLPTSLYQPIYQPEDYLAFLGRISPEKGAGRAIAIARQAGLPLKIAGKVHDADREYYEAVLRPLMDPSIVEFVGEIGEHEKNEFLGRARALLFPIEWPEPFGLVMIEAMACGTPVFAYPYGSVPEIIDHGVTALVVDSLELATQAAGAVERLSRRRCREVFETRFAAKRMARDYVSIYEQPSTEGGHDPVDQRTLTV